MYPKYIFSLERDAALALRRQPLQPAAKSNHPPGNFFCHVDNFGNNVRLSRYILESILTLKTAKNLLKHHTGQQTVLRAL